MASPEISQAVETYLHDCKARGLRPASLTTYRRQLGDFQAFTEAAQVTHIDQVSAPVLRSYFASLQDRGLRPASIRSHGRVIRIFLNFCTAAGMIPDTPMRGVRMPRQPKPHPDAFSPAEVQKLVDAALDKRARAVLLCLLDTGCRVSEFTAWRRADVDLDAGRVTIRRETSKTATQRTVFLGERARAALRAYLDETPPADYVWAHKKTGAPLTVKGITSILLRIADRAGVQPARPHRYRRTALSYMLRDGMDIYAVADIAGHSTIDLLKFYITGADDDALSASHAKHSPVDRLLK